MTRAFHQPFMVDVKGPRLWNIQPSFLPVPPPRQLFPRRHKFYQSTSSVSQVVARIAILGTVPDTLPNAILAPGYKPSDICIATAKSQHEAYRTALSASNISSLLQLPPNPSLPDSVFVEDPVVIVSPKTAFMPKAGHSSREGEGAALASVLTHLGVSLMRSPDVKLDGGDVLKIGRFIVVGITSRTESAALPVLQRVVEEDFDKHSSYLSCPRVVGVPVVDGLHLKSLVTWIGPFGEDGDGTLVAPNTGAGRNTVQSIAAATGRSWDVAWVREEDAHAANVIYLPPRDASGQRDDAAVVLMQGACPQAMEVVDRKLKRMNGLYPSAQVVGVDMSELAKANGALTCCSVLV